MINDLKTDPLFGDFIFQNDFQMIYNDTLLLNIVAERLKTDHGDLRLTPDSGANISSFLGKELNTNIIDNISLSIINALTWDNLLPTDAIEILPVKLDNNTLYVRTIIQSRFSGEELTLDNTYDLNGNAL